jgi:hypothetical protein
MTDVTQEPVVAAQPAPAASVAAPDVTPSTDNVVPAVAQADSTPAPEATPSAEPSPTLDDVAPQKSRAQERIEDLVAERNAAKEYAEYWRQEALKIREHATTATRSPQPQEAPPPDVVPTLEQFGFDHAKWSKAHAEWTDRQIERRVQAMVPQVVEQRSSQEAQNAAIEAFNEKIEKFKETHPDFEIAMQNPKIPALDKTAAAMVVASDHAAELTYALVKNPDLTTRISRMAPAQQALAIGRLESQVKGESAPVSKQQTPTPRPATAPAASVGTTQAPPPPTPVPAGGAAEVSPENTDIRTWMKIRNQEARSRRR